MASHLYLFVGMALLLGSKYSFGEECPNAERANDCETCISLSPGCAWCKNKYFEDYKFLRCGTRLSLRENGCSEKDIVDPESQHTVAEKGRNLSPQRIKLDLRPGESHTFQVEAKLPRKARPVGVYILTSFSMNNKGRGRRAKVLADTIIEGIAKSNEKQQVHPIGYGLFGNTVVTDKRQKECEERGEECEPELYVTHSTAEPQNPYSPNFPWRNQGGLQALMQVALCKDVIHWGDHKRVLVYASDGTYELAPETETRYLDTINSSICLMNNSFIRTPMRPPSVSELRNVLLENNIQVIFVTEDDVIHEYYRLKDELPKSSVAWVDTLDPNSAVVQRAFENLSTSLVLTHLPVPGLNVTYEPLCDSFLYRRNLYGTCYVRGSQIKKSQTFNVTVLSESCELPASFEIKNLGSTESLTVELTARCNCECGDQPDPEFCSYAGNPVCGKCRCNEGHFGSLCECSISDDVTPCTEKQGAPVCSGRGTCVCKQCECNRGVYGRYCECDDSSCPWSGGKICGGNGRCVCGRCVCAEDYVGEACDCSTKVDRCQSPNGVLCSGRGLCQCNQCVCESVFKGALCDECPVC